MAGKLKPLLFASTTAVGHQLRYCVPRVETITRINTSPQKYEYCDASIQLNLSLY